MVADSPKPSCTMTLFHHRMRNPFPFNSMKATGGIITFLLLVSAALSLSPQLRRKPLIGGPPWLKVHVQVCVTNELTCDFIPLDATKDSTLAKLITLQSVPGEIRTIWRVREETIVARRAIDYCEKYESTDLHLLYNNCWTFALGLLWHLYEEGKRKI